MILIFLKGLLIGSTLSVPGVSGGTMAMLIGVYEPLVHAVNILITKNKRKKEAVLFLLTFSFGGLLGFLAISSLILNLIQIAPMPMIFLFGGVIAGGVPKIYNEIKKERFVWTDVVYFCLGLLIVLFISYLPKDLFQLAPTMSFWGLIKQIIGGLLVAFALVLPGISVSHMLYILGIYESVLKAISDFDFLCLLPMVCGISLGILLFARLMEICFVRFRKMIYSLIFGFVIGSVLELFSQGITGAFSFICIPMSIIGFCLMHLISKKQADA